MSHGKHVYLIVLGFLLGPSEQGEMYFEPPDIDVTPLPRTFGEGGVVLFTN